MPATHTLFHRCLDVPRGYCSDRQVYYSGLGVDRVDGYSMLEEELLIHVVPI